MLLIRVSSYPGWHAKVDGKSAKLITADYMFQAVPLTAGTHRIKLTFAPRSLRVGEIVSLATLALLLAVLGSPARAHLPPTAQVARLRPDRRHAPREPRGPRAAASDEA